MQLHKRSVSWTKILLGLIAGAVLGNALPTFAEHTYSQDSSKWMPKEDDLVSMTFVCRYPSPLIAFRTEQGMELYARVLPASLVQSPCPSSGSYRARLQLEAGNFKFSLVDEKDKKKADLAIQWKIVFHHQARALELLRHWIKHQFKDEFGTITLDVITLHIKDEATLLKHCKDGRYPGDVADGTIEVYTLPYRFVRYGNQAMPQITEKDGRFRVSYPQSVYRNSYFDKDVPFMPPALFLPKGLMLDKDELVRIHVYDGSLYDEQETYTCIHASRLPELARIAKNQTLLGMAITGVEVVALAIPGRLIAAAVQKTGRGILLGTVLGMSEVTPELVAQGTLQGAVQTGVRQGLTTVVEQVGEQATARAVTTAAGEGLVAAGSTAAVAPVATGVGTQVAVEGAIKAGTVGVGEGAATQLLKPPTIEPPVTPVAASKVLFTTNGLRVVSPHVVYTSGTLSATESGLVTQVETRLIQLTQQAIKNVEAKVSSTVTAKTFYKMAPSSSYYSARLGSAIHEEAFVLIQKDSVFNGLTSNYVVKTGLPAKNLVGHYAGLIPDIRMGLSNGTEVVWDITTTKQLGKAIKYQQPFVVEIRELLY